MSYFEMFCQNLDDRDSEAIVGTCETMCPEEEVAMRESQYMVHILEVWGTDRNLVKAYARSAADKSLAVPHLLRPFPVLRKTLDFLLLECTKRTDVSGPILYDFINDRMRAIRQDMIIQRLRPQECAQLLEPMIRFYVMYGYRLCELPTISFDPLLNIRNMNECIKWFLTCYDEGKEEDLANMLSNLNLSSNLKCDRILVECLYIVSNLGDESPLIRFLSLPKSLRSHPKLELAYRIAISNLKGNFLRTCRLVDDLCVLPYIAFHITYLAVVQRRGLQIMSTAYSNRYLSVHAEIPRRWLHFSSTGHAIVSCEYYGLERDGSMIRFYKPDFKDDLPIHRTQKRYLLDRKYDFTTDAMLLYTTDDVRN